MVMKYDLMMEIYLNSTQGKQLKVGSNHWLFLWKKQNIVGKGENADKKYFLLSPQYLKKKKKKNPLCHYH